jgi:hypothetical protein
LKARKEEKDLIDLIGPPKVSNANVSTSATPATTGHQTTKALVGQIQSPKPSTLEAAGVDRPTHPALVHGRRTAIPAAILNAVRLRDGGRCTYVHSEYGRCRNSRWTQVHHLHGVAQGGQHDLQNLTTLCSAHHRDLHRTVLVPIPNPKEKNENASAARPT